MAHFAKLGVGDKVIKVEVVADNIATTEQAGIDFLNQLYKTNDVWKQTSITGEFRKNHAGIGWQYDKERDAFIPPQPFPSWVLNENTCFWEAPVAFPDDGSHYVWNEKITNWE
jgi:hypothetical protein